MLRNIEYQSQEIEIAQTTNGTAVKLDGVKGFQVTHEATVTTPTAKTFTAVAATDVCTSAAHGFKTGLKGQCTTTGGLPGGLATTTDYFVIVLSSTTFKLASSLNNANAGTAIDLTTAGTGTQTFTATALAGANVKLQLAVEEDAASATWYDIAAATNITTTATFNLLEKLDPMYRWVRAVHTMTAGQLSLKTKYLIKGDA